MPKTESWASEDEMTADIGAQVHKDCVPTANGHDAIDTAIDAVEVDKHLPLTEDERDLLEALDGQIRATFQVTIEPLQKKMAERLRRIERRLSLPEQSIGRTHHIADGEVRAGPPMPQGTG